MPNDFLAGKGIEAKIPVAVRAATVGEAKLLSAIVRIPFASLSRGRVAR